VVGQSTGLAAVDTRTRRQRQGRVTVPLEEPTTGTRGGFNRTPTTKSWPCRLPIPYSTSRSACLTLELEDGVTVAKRGFVA